jgi:hypothetical protein
MNIPFPAAMVSANRTATSHENNDKILHSGLSFGLDASSMPAGNGRASRVPDIGQVGQTSVE